MLKVTPALPAVSNEQYSEILPRKPTFERDVAIEHQLAKAPAILTLLQIISSVPMELVRCLDVVKSILALTIGFWNQQASSVAMPTAPNSHSFDRPYAAPPTLVASTQVWTSITDTNYFALTSSRYRVATLELAITRSVPSTPLARYRGSLFV